MPNGRYPHSERPRNPKSFYMGSHGPFPGDIEPRNDKDIRGDVESALFYDATVDSVEVKVDVKDGGVTLIGCVDSDGARRIAEEDARGVPGVRDVRNCLQIREAPAA